MHQHSQILTFTKAGGQVQQQSSPLTMLVWKFAKRSIILAMKHVLAGAQATGLAILGNLATEKSWRAALAADDHSCKTLLECAQHALCHAQPTLQQKAANLLSNAAAASHICAQVIPASQYRHTALVS